MKLSKSLICVALIFIGLYFVSCDNEPIDPALLPTPVNTCATPTGLSASDFVGGSNVNLTWTAAPGTGAWQVQYGPAGFTVGSGTQVVASNNSVTITGLNSANDYDFYVRTACSVDSFSEWIGPVGVGESVVNPTDPNVTYGYLSANVDGVQFNGLKPYLYPIVGTQAKLQTLEDDMGRYLWLQGNSTPTSNPPTGLEINIRIHEDFWEPSGAHPLVSQNDIVWPGISVDLIDLSNDGAGLVSESELPGTITVTEFNAATRRIRGTFSFTFNKIDDLGTTGPFDVTGGTFDFEVPAEAF